MRHYLFLILCSFTSMVVSAQEAEGCDQLAIEFHGVVRSDAGDQLFFEVSNALYTGTLYYYPGFILLNEQGDTLAKEATRYYGIGSNFQTHLLEIKSDLSFPIVGRLELYGSYYQHFFCSFPMRIEAADVVDLKEIEEQAIKIAANYAGDHMIIDLGGNYWEEETKYHIDITHENGEARYDATLTEDITSIPLTTLGGSGSYSVRIWDELSKKQLSTKRIRME